MEDEKRARCIQLDNDVGGDLSATHLSVYRRGYALRPLLQDLGTGTYHAGND